MTVFLIVGIIACSAFAWYAFASGAEIDELRYQVEKLQKQLNSTQADLRKNTDVLGSVQRELANLKPKYSPSEYEGPDIVVPELSASEEEKMASQIKILLGR